MHVLSGAVCGRRMAFRAGQPCLRVGTVGRCHDEVPYTQQVWTLCADAWQLNKGPLYKDAYAYTPVFECPAVQLPCRAWTCWMGGAGNGSPCQAIVDLLP